MRKQILSVSISALFGTAGLAQVITVDRARDDFTDFGGGHAVIDLPGPDGHVTLREAIEAANNTPGPQTIEFAIPTSEWSIFFNDRAIILIENMLMVSDDETTIDFSTQSSFTGDTNPNGGEVGIQYAGVPASIPSLWLNADHCVLRGLDIGFGNNFSNTIWITGNYNRVIGCTTNGLMIRGDYGGGAYNTIGGSGAGEGNVFSEWVDILSDADHNTLFGNYCKWGVRISGDTFWGTCDGNRVGGPGAGERNILSGHGYYAEEGFPSGTQIEVYHATGTIIEGNYIGTSPDGMAMHPGRSGTLGVGVGIGAVGTVVRDNVISGLIMVGTNHYQGQRFGTGVAVVASARDTIIQGNRIGLAADGVSPLPNVQGAVVQSDPNGVPFNVLFGGISPEEANAVAHNETTGLRVGNAATGVRIRGNSFYANGGIAIDLTGSAAPGVTPNDVLDLDNGGNRLQNFPELESVTGSAASTHVVGTLHSSATSTFVVDFYGSDECDPSGFGEGRLWLGSTSVTTAADGNAVIDVLLPVGDLAGDVLTATATDIDGNTSEFSACTLVAGAGLVGDMNCDGLVSVGDIGGFVLALSDPAGYAAAYSGCRVLNADVNQDGFVSVGDIGAFVSLLSGR